MKKFLFTVMLAVFALPVAAYEIALPGENNKIDLYGQVYMHAWYQRGVINDKVQGGSADGNDLIYAMQGNSRLGVTLKLGEFFSTVETNFAGDGGTGFGFRLLFGGYDFGKGGVLTIGRQYILTENIGPYNCLFDTDFGLTGYGTLATMRAAMIKYAIAGFEFALVDMTAKYSNYSIRAVQTVGGEGDQKISTQVADKWLPNIEVAYNLITPIGSGKISASYVATDVSVSSSDVLGLEGKRTVIHTAMAAAVFTFNVGNLAISPSAFYALNGGLVGRVYAPMIGSATLLMPTEFRTTKNADGTYSLDGVKDISTYGVALGFNYKINSMISVEVGGGYSESRGSSIRTAADKTTALKSYSAYIDAPIHVVKYLTITPIVGWFAGSTDAVAGTLYSTILDAKGNKPLANKNTSSLIAGLQLKVAF